MLAQRVPRVKARSRTRVRRTARAIDPWVLCHRVPCSAYPEATLRQLQDAGPFPSVRLGRGGRKAAGPLLLRCAGARRSADESGGDRLKIGAGFAAGNTGEEFAGYGGILAQ